MLAVCTFSHGYLHFFPWLLFFCICPLVFCFSGFSVILSPWHYDIQIILQCLSGCWVLCYSLRFSITFHPKKISFSKNHTASRSARNVITYVNLWATGTICMFKVTHVLPSSLNLGHRERKNVLMIIAVSEGSTSIYLNRNHESTSLVFRAPFSYILQAFVKANFCSEKCSMRSKISEIRVWRHVCVSINTGGIHMAIWTDLWAWEMLKKIACDLETINGVQIVSSKVMTASACAQWVIQD